LALQVFIVRHAIAEDREDYKKRSGGKSDSLRPLTKEGRRQFKKMARAVSEIAGDVDLIVSSPLTRALDTATMLKKRFPEAQEITIDELKPGKSSVNLLNWLRHVRSSRVILVGHEPSLGEHLTFFLTGRSRSALELKKGGFCVVEFADRIEKGAAKLVCCIQPSQLRKLSHE
jgi:phosphohistidine phosphatase